MKRLLYMILAVSLSGGVPASAAVEDLVDDVGEDLSDLTESSLDRRGRPAVLVVPAELAPAADAHGVAGRLMVDRSRRDVVDVSDVEAPTAPWAGVVTAQLLDAALARCRADGALKLRLDVALPLERVTQLCRRKHFHYWRTVMRRGRTVHEYYRDLYTGLANGAPQA